MICSVALCNVAHMSVDLDSPHERLAWAREKAGYATKTAFAEAIGMAPVTYRAYESGQNGFAKFAAEFARRLGVSAEWLLGGGLTPDISAQDLRQQVDFVEIQQVDHAYGLGATFADGHVDVEVLQFPRTWVEAITTSPPALLTWARGKGDSMAPTIHDGDLVLLDRSQRHVTEQDALWAYTVGDLGSIKRLRVKGDKFIILSDNPYVPDDEEPIELVNIVARVVFIGKRS